MLLLLPSLDALKMASHCTPAQGTSNVAADLSGLYWFLAAADWSLAAGWLPKLFEQASDGRLQGSDVRWRCTRPASASRVLLLFTGAKTKDEVLL